MGATTITKNKKQKIALNRYAGQWVAFAQDKVAAVSPKLSDLMKEIDAMGLRKKASVFLVPRKDEGPYILLAL